MPTRSGVGIVASGYILDPVRAPPYRGGDPPPDAETTVPSLKPSQIAQIAGAVVLLIFSFFAFFKADTGFGDISYNAWDGDGFMPLTIFPLLLGLVVGGSTAASAFGNVKLPDEVLTLNWKQVNLTLSFAALLILLGLMISGPAGLDTGIGLIVSLLGGIALLAGSVMDLLGIEVGGAGGTGGGPGSSGAPPSPF